MAGKQWIVEADVLSDLGLAASDDRVPRCIAAAEQQVQDWREDVVDWTGPTGVVLNYPDVYQAGVRLACLLYQQAATPEGWAGFDDGGGILLPENAQMVSIRRLARAHRPRVG